MPWTVESPPDVAKNWDSAQKAKCVSAANSIIRNGGADEDAVFACIYAAGKSDMKKIMRVSESGFDVEIFATGKWNGKEFADKDLHDIVTNFYLLKNVQKVPLKLGHNDDQPLTDGMPALGWVSDVWVEGNKLMAKFDDVPEIIRDAIKKKKYRTVSVELLLGAKHKGKEYKNVLDAVALLGADQPAVNTLKDLNTYLSRTASWQCSRRAIFSAVNGEPNNELIKEEIKMDEEIKKRFDALESSLSVSTAKILEVSKENEQLKTENMKMKRDEDDRVKKDRKTKIDFNRSESVKILEDAVKNKNILPAQREVFSKILKLDDDDSVFSISIEDVKKLVEDVKMKSNFSNQQARSSNKEDRVFEDAGDEIHRLALEKIDENSKLSYSRALELVMQNNRILAAEHIGGLAEEGA